MTEAGAGSYTLRLLLDDGRVEDAMAELSSQLSALQTRLGGATEADVISALKIHIAAIEKRQDYFLSRLTPDPTVSAWCADRTEGLTGEVGTIEVPGERGAVQIRPGHDGGAVYDGERDGQLQQALCGTPAAVFFNRALLPCWQKYKPLYRYGTITAIDREADTADVELAAATSSAQDIDINQSETLEGIPVSYMDCNAAAFEEGDVVVVEFVGQEWSGARVIGFQSEPRACAWEFYIRRFDGEVLTPDNWYGFKWYDSDNVDVTDHFYHDFDAETQVFRWRLLPGYTIAPEGYWVEYAFLHDLPGLPVQYPGIYDVEIARQEAHLIGPGYYEDTIPYWWVERGYRYNPEPGDWVEGACGAYWDWGEQVMYADQSAGEGFAGNAAQAVEENYGMRVVTDAVGISFERRRSIYSSIPYQVRAQRGYIYRHADDNHNYFSAWDTPTGDFSLTARGALQFVYSAGGGTAPAALIAEEGDTTPETPMPNNSLYAFEYTVGAGAVTAGGLEIVIPDTVAAAETPLDLTPGRHVVFFETGNPATELFRLVARDGHEGDTVVIHTQAPAASELLTIYCPLYGIYLRRVIGVRTPQAIYELPQAVIDSIVDTHTGRDEARNCGDVIVLCYKAQPAWSISIDGSNHAYPALGTPDKYPHSTYDPYDPAGQQKAVDEIDAAATFSTPDDPAAVALRDHYGTQSVLYDASVDGDEDEWFVDYRYEYGTWVGFCDFTVQNYGHNFLYGAIYRESVDLNFQYAPQS